MLPRVVGVTGESKANDARGAEPLWGAIATGSRLKAGVLPGVFDFPDETALNLLFYITCFIMKRYYTRYLKMTVF